MVSRDVCKSIRIINYVIDVVIVYIITGLIVAFTGYNLDGFVALFILYPIYCFVFELFIKQTVGKMITKTKVVTLDNTKPNVYRIFMRAVCRLNPLDLYSYLFGYELGGHDLISRTKLVHKN